MLRELRAASMVFLMLTVLTGALYPGFVTVAAKLLFAPEASGSLVEVQGGRPGEPEGERGEGRVVGSSLLGQFFTSPKYFWGRPSATAPQPYNGGASSGSNQGPTNPALAAAVRDRVAALRGADPGNPLPVPVDLVTASGSGLDPHISPAAAEYQLARVARVRGLAEARVRELVQDATRGRTFGLLGEPRVNVLELNLALDAQTSPALSPARGPSDADAGARVVMP